MLRNQDMPVSIKTSIFCGILALLLLSIRVVDGAESTEIDVVTDKLFLRFDVKAAQPIRWTACAPSCSHGNKVTVDFTAPVIEPTAWLPRQARTPLQALDSTTYTVFKKERAGSVLLEFVSEPIAEFGILKKSYTISKTRYEVVVSTELLDAIDGTRRHPKTGKLDLTVGEQFVQQRSSGFASFFERVRTLVIGGNEVKDFAEAVDESEQLMLSESHWVGIRNRFWAIFVQAGEMGGRARAQVTAHGLPHLTVESAANSHTPLRYRIYSGPISLGALQQTSADLQGILFAGLWWWLRLLCLGLMFLLSGLYAFIGNYGVAIIALALVVKLLMSPLTAIAEKWQREVNIKRSQLQPLIDEIKANYKGEEQVNRILQVHKAHDTHILYSLKSMFGFLIQIPIFIAAFDMLSENFALNAVPFLWIEDLAMPDQFLRLPFSIPFFGAYVNLLPFIMAFITVLASVHFEAPTLSPQLKRKQQQHLYAMAALFFVLFYTFPAGMVLYWTSTNLLQFLKEQIMRLVRVYKARSR